MFCDLQPVLQFQYFFAALSRFKRYKVKVYTLEGRHRTF